MSANQRPLVIDPTNGSTRKMAQDGSEVLAPELGGTGANTPAAARIALGVQIGVNVQAYNAELDGLAGLNAVGAVFRTAAGAYSSRSFIQPAAGITIANPTGATGDPTFALANDLAALEALNGTGIPVRTANDTWTQRQLAVASNQRLTVADASGVGGNPTFDLATLGDGGGGAFLKFVRDNWGRVSGTSNVVAADLVALLAGIYARLDGATFTGPVTVPDPTQPYHAANMRTITAFGQNRRDKGSVRLAIKADVNIANPGTIGDGAVLANVTDRVILIGNASQAENGPWVYNGGGVALTRPDDFDETSEIAIGSTYFVSEGDEFGNQSMTLISDGPFVLGTTALEFTQTSSTGQITPDVGLKKSGNTLSLDYGPRLSLASGKLDLANGIVAPGTGTKITTNSYGQVVAVANAVPSDIGAQIASVELDGISALASNGMVVRTAAGAYSPRIMVQPGAGFQITNPTGAAGNFIFTLSDDLAAIEALAGVGFATRTAANTWAQRVLAVASTARLTVTFADGVGGNPTFDLAVSGITPGTYNGPTTYDAYGRAIAGTNIANLNTPGSTLTNDEATQVVIGAPVYIDGAGSFKKGVANSLVTSDLEGLLFQTTASGAQGIVASSGPLTATTAQWDAVTGQTGGLTSGAKYYLDNAQAGKLTSTPPTTGFLARVGKATSATTMTVRIDPVIGL